MKNIHVITGRRSSGETLVLNKQGEFSLRTTSARLYARKDALESLKVLAPQWKGLALKVESVGDGSGLFDLISDNAQIGQDGY